MFNHSGGTKHRLNFIILNNMKYYISEGRRVYEDINHGFFSKELSKWAISNMKVKDTESEKMKAIKPHSIEEMKEVLKSANVTMKDDCIYSAWYLYNMTFADYPKTIKTDEQRASFIQETLLDPDCCPEAVLECFVAKMCIMGKPIFWENYL